MTTSKAICACTVLGLLGLPTSALALGGGIGCTNLPEYERALGTIENGPGSCDMTLEEAQRIIARTQGQTAQPPAPATSAAPRHHRHHHHHKPATYNP